MFAAAADAATAAFAAFPLIAVQSGTWSHIIPFRPPAAGCL